MKTAEQFLVAIEARPSDRSLRAVFADWLMERDDIRGELIVAEEEAWGHAPTGDAYWRGKTNRDALRQAIRAMPDGPSFLRALGYGDRYMPVLGTPAADWRSRWRLIRELTIRWFGVPLPDVGRPIDSKYHALAEGRRLSPSIAEWIAFADDLPTRVLAGVEQIVSPARPAVARRDDSTVALAGSGYAAYVVNREAISEDDPPVAGARLSGEGTALFQTVTEFALMTMLHAAFLSASSIRGRTSVERPRDLLLQLPGGVEFGNIVVAEGRGWLAFADHTRDHDAPLLVALDDLDPAGPSIRDALPPQLEPIVAD